MKRVSILLVMLILISILVACGSDSSAKNSTNDESNGKEIRFAHPYDEKHPLHLASVQFAEQVEKETNGSIKFKFYPNGSLGGANDLMEGLQIGTVDMSLIATPIAGKQYKPLDLFYLPYLFNNREHAYKVADGEVGQTLYQGLEDKLGVKTLAMFESGFRTITNSKHTVKSPDDLEGLKLRFADAPISIDTFKALGANGTPIALGELFTALQQGTVDGQDNPLGNVYTLKFYEVQPYITISEHQWAGIMVLIKDEIFNGFTKEEQQIVLDAARDAQEWQREEMQKAEEEYLIAMEKEGVKITELTQEDKAGFKKILEDLWIEYEKDIGKDLIQKAVDAGKD